MHPNLSKLQPYPFERLRALLAGVVGPQSLAHISMSIGEPRHAPPTLVIEALRQAADSLGSYPTALGLPALRQSISRWLSRRFALPAGCINPDSMILPVNGTREALFAFVQAVVDPYAQAVVACPNPFYQIYEGAAYLAGAEPYFMNAGREQDYLPDLDAVPPAIWKRCEVLFLCSPGNPTGAVASIDYLQHALTLANRYDFVVASDECYSEIYFDEAAPPPGLLQAAVRSGHTQLERCMVFHSLSKRSSVPGLRSGFVAGDPLLIKPFLLYRTYHGCAMPVHHQLASIPAWDDDAHVIENRSLYRRKFAGVLPLLQDVLDVDAPAASFYLWPHVGEDERFTRELFQQQHLTVLPGSFIARDTPAGNPGRGRVRISLVAGVDECLEAAHRIRNYVATRR